LIESLEISTIQSDDNYYIFFPKLALLRILYLTSISPVRIYDAIRLRVAKVTKLFLYDWDLWDEKTGHQGQDLKFVPLSIVHVRNVQ
jgi:hypothetical protein